MKITQLKNLEFIKQLKVELDREGFEVYNEKASDDEFEFEVKKFSRFEVSGWLTSQTHTVYHAIMLENDRQVIYDTLNEALDELDSAGSFIGQYGLYNNALYRNNGTILIYRNKVLTRKA